MQGSVVLEGILKLTPKQIPVSCHSKPKSLASQLTVAGYFCVILPSTTYFIKNRKPLLKAIMTTYYFLSTFHFKVVH